MIRNTNLYNIASGDTAAAIAPSERPYLETPVWRVFLSRIPWLLLLMLSAAVAAVVSLTLGVTAIAAKLIGCTLPMLAKKLGFDPAVMASPFITTLVDAVSLLTYFRIAALLLGL